jgi:hypothetical protein
MQHGTVGHGQREVLAPAAADQLGEVDTPDAARVVEAHLVAYLQVMPLAGDDHVVVAVVAHFARAVQAMGRHGAGHGQPVALAFLATKATTHPPHLDPNGGHGQVQRMGDLMLDLGRVLGRGLDEHAVFLRDGGTDLAFQVEMLLPADFEFSFQPVWGAGDAMGGVALRPQDRTVFETAVRGKGLLDGE